MQSKLNHLLVFPTSRKVREYIYTNKENNTLLPTILTIDDFFKKSIYFDNKKIIDEDERFLYLSEAVKNIDLNLLGISKTFSQFLKQYDYIYRFFLELSSEGILIDDINSKDTYEFYSEHLNILKEIYKNYIGILEKNNSIDKINTSLHYKINYEFINQFEHIDFYFEGHFTKFEFNIIKDISEIIPFSIDFTYNQYNKKSIENFFELGLDLVENYKYKIDINKRLVLDKKSLIENENIDIKAFSSRINQIAYIKSNIVKLVNEGVNPSKIALILPDEKFSKMIKLFDSEGYFNFAMGKDIGNSKIYKVLDAIYEYISEIEIKNINNLKFLNLNIDEINLKIKSVWNNKLTIESFESITNYLLDIETNKEIIEKLEEIIYRMKKLIFSSEDKVYVKDFFKILFQKISKLSIDDVNSGKITVIGLLESRMLELDAVLICDFNESFIPKRSVKDKFLSTQIKSKVNLPTAIDRENLQKYYYERLISNSKHVYISYVKNETEQISRFASKLFKKDLDEKTYDNEYKQILYKNHSIKHYEEEIILEIDLSKIVWSATSLKEFLECKRKYYLNHILNIKEHDLSLLPKGYELGNIIHKTLEEFFKCEIQNEEKLIEIYNSKKIESNFLNFELEVWKKKLIEFYDLEVKRINDYNIKILELEKQFLVDFNGIKIKGTIDRVDIVDDNVIVIDYKTSKNLTVSTKRTYLDSTDFQLEFYYIAIKDLLKVENIKTYYYDLYNLTLIEENMIHEKIDMLTKKFSEFYTQKVRFDKCDNLNIYQYCPYKTICNR
jgi:inactivated superfamily I helicase